ncbi:MAG: exonuclease domain-containing protein [Schleiferiaceae bacterium]
MKFVVVDIETTGGRPSGNDITEIGIVHVQNKKIVHQWSSLVKPDSSIPNNIQALTGISDEMVEHAPKFQSLIPLLQKQLEGDVFVAHSVNFDYSFIERAFRECEVAWRMDKLCTIKYARKVFPEIGRYSLANLARELQVSNNNPHRALSDALCAAEVLIHCLHGDYDQKMLHNPKTGLLQRIQIPDNLPREQYDNLPKAYGIYEFKDAQGKSLYIGKANNIKKRVTQHFSTQKESAKYHRLMKECHFLEYTILPNEILALILEDHKIREHWPALNKSQKKQSLKFGLYAYENGKGEVKWVIQKAIGNGALRKFGTYQSGQTWLANFLEEVNSNHTDDLEVLKNLKQSLQRSWIVALDEGGAVFIENGNLTGIYIEDDFLHQKEWVRKHFINIQPSPILNSIGQKLMEQRPNKVIEI